MAPTSPTNNVASVQAVVRLRPLNDKEMKHGTLPVVSANTDAKTVTVLKGTGSRQIKTSYKFDNVFTAFSTQQDVFDETLKPVIKDVLMGYESTLFAYGQTGTGKTHTMEGSLEDPDLFGVIPRSASAIFTELQQNPEFVSSRVYCSFLEIYNEELCDLLVDKSTNPTKLAIMEGKNGPFCRGLSVSQVSSAEDVLGLMRKAQQQRQVAETNMNKQSSRSHCIFTLRVEAKRQLVDGSTMEVAGKLHCVDLAGSECAKSADLGIGHGEQQAARERERMNINRSLLTLGRVVSTLKEISQNPKKSSVVRIPYRDSKLTRILQESLGGRCKTVLIATISPSVTAIEESLSTLNYAQAANGIINKPVTTSFMTACGGAPAASQFSDNKSPTGESGAGTVEHWHDMEVRLEYMQAQVEEAQQALARKHIQHQEIVDRAEQADQARKAAERNYHEATHRVVTLETHLEQTTEKLIEVEQSLSNTKMILVATQQTETSLTEEATALLQALKETISDGDGMHTSLLRNREKEIYCKECTKSIRCKMSALFQNILESLTTIDALQKRHRSELCETHSQKNLEMISLLDSHKVTIEELKNTCVDKSRQLRGTIHEGLIPSFLSFAVKLKDGLESLEGTTKKGSDDLQSHCDVLSTRLDETVSYLQEARKTLAIASQGLTTEVDASVKASKENLDMVATNLEEALKEAAVDRSDRRTKLDGVLTVWKDSCHASVDTMQTMSSAHVQNLGKTASVFEDESQHRMEITSSISQHAAFLSQKKETYIRLLECQNELLKKRYNALLSAQSQQQERNNAMVRNVMAGVQELLQKEITDISEFQNDQYSILSSENLKSLQANRELSTCIADDFDDLQMEVENFATKVQSNFARQESASHALRKTAAGFTSSLDTCFKDIRTAVDVVAAESLDILHDFESGDIASTKTITKRFAADIKNVGSELTSIFPEKVKTGVSNIHNWSEDVFTHVNEDFITNVRSNIVNEIQIPQGKITSYILSLLEELSAEVTIGEKVIEKEANNNLEVAIDMQKQIEDTSASFARCIDEHKLGIQQSSWLETQTECHEQDFLQNVSVASKNVDLSTMALQCFTRDVIRCEEEPNNIQERFVPSFSYKLSSTPHPETILKNVLPLSSKENEKTTSAVSSTSTSTAGVLEDSSTNFCDSGKDDLSSFDCSAKRRADNALYASRMGKKTKI